MAPGKRLPALELPEEETGFAPVLAAAAPAASKRMDSNDRPSSIPLPPIPAAPRREIMVQLSIKAPLALVERLEGMTKTTGAQKQAVMAAALDAYLRGHGY
jgi:hypothetical protein